jgi:Xaa-Pro dipeptidase
MTSNIFITRQKRLLSALQQSTFDIIAINAGPTLAYFTGLDFHLMERPVVLFLSKENQPIIVIPEFERIKLNDSPYLISFTYSEDPDTWTDAFRKSAEILLSSNPKSIGVEELQMRFFELKFIQTVFPKCNISSCQNLIASLRLTKDELEKQSLQQAVLIAEKALSNTIPFIKPGVTERELASELSLNLLRAGSDPQLPFPPIIASGPNSANPHAVPTDRKLGTGDSLIIDWGARFHGYVSDLTRTFAIGKPNPELMSIYRVVQSANEIGRQFVRPGITAESVDQQVRQHISQAGFGQFFTHRTGHGIGLDPHEEPYIREGNKQILQPGMTFTVEPGIYLPDRVGVRIEDNLFITSNGAITLTSYNRDLLIIE